MNLNDEIILMRSTRENNKNKLIEYKKVFFEKYKRVLLDKEEKYLNRTKEKIKKDLIDNDSIAFDNNDIAYLQAPIKISEKREEVEKIDKLNKYCSEEDNKLKFNHSIFTYYIFFYTLDGVVYWDPLIKYNLDELFEWGIKEGFEVTGRYGNSSLCYTTFSVRNEF